MKYGIICAMEEEIKTLVEKLANKQEQSIADMKYYTGTINGHEVVLVQSGIGKVQAAVNTAFLANNFQVDCIINSGSAGGIGDGMHVGDVVLSTGTAYHDADSTAFGYKMGQMPGQPQIFEADAHLRAAVKKAAEENGLPVREGLIVTGDQFINSTAKIKTLLNEYRKTSDGIYQRDLSTALTATSDKAAIQEILECFKDADTIKPQDLREWYVGLLGNSEAQQAAWDWMRDNWDWLIDTLGGDMEFHTYVTVTANTFYTKQRYDEFKAFYEPKLDTPGLRREIEMDVNLIKGKVDLIEAEKSAVEQAIANEVK